MKNVNNAVNLTGKMATDTFAVSFTATKGAKFIFSKIGTVPERQTFSELYDTHSGTDPLRLKSVLVSRGPAGPWQEVDPTECLAILRQLEYRHIQFKCDDSDMEVDPQYCQCVSKQS